MARVRRAVPGPAARGAHPELSGEGRDALTLDRSGAVGVEATAKDGDVTLTGAVRHGAERAAAEALIACLTGVRSVTNDIGVRADADPLYP
jgi:osmotically-inducible protein OsmY